MTKILVTGASGQLGKTIKELYSNNKIGLNFTFVTKEDLDITVLNDLQVFFKKNSFDYCINCAAYTNVEQAEKTPNIAFKINAEGAKNLAKICKVFSTVLIHISTDYVFDGEKEEPYSTYDKPNPINEYGKSKLEGEEHIRGLMKNYFIIRTSWLYSKKHGNNFYKSILKKAKTEKKVFVTDSQTGCPTDAANLSKFIILLIVHKSHSFGMHHFRDQKIMTWFDFAKEILSKNNLLAKTNLVRVAKYSTFAVRPKTSVLSLNN
ncbi:dTDP-4-dehydrorhamnose reductase [Algibacter aquimarinus]|uniref:dTDP-4-dehydrorhamnose reductase n=1 Tax=Algibacter aquimarinus TaxID=1136748 RepID=A0ABP9HCW1_9FLAO